MRVPIGQTHTTVVGGEIVKHVQCTKCATRFVYVAERQVGGSGTSVLWLDDEGAQRRSAAAADEKLRKELRRALEMVPCPKCGMYQPAMVRHMKLKRAAILWVIGSVLAIGVWFPGATGQLQYGGTIAISIFLGFVAAGAIWFGLHDPNRGDAHARAAGSAGVLLADYEALLHKSRSEQAQQPAVRRSSPTRKRTPPRRGGADSTK